MSSIKLVQKPVKSLMDELGDLSLVDEKRTEQVAETGGVLFSNGRCIELFRDKTGQLSLLDSSDNRFRQRIEYQGQTYVPPIIHPSLSEALRLPTGRTHNSTANNFKQICSVLMEHNIYEQAAKKLTYWILTTWFAELFPVAPCLILTGSQPEASLVLQLLSCAVRHGVSLADIKYVGIPMFPDAYPTDATD